MSKQGKGNKPLIIGIVAAVAVLAVVLALLLTQCVGGGAEATQSTPVQTTVEEIPTYDLYWNLDRAEYDGKSEAGMSSRQQESDGYFHIRFFKDGETMELRAADRKVINAIDVNDLMGLEFDENGIIIGVISLDDMPVEQVGWQFYVQSSATKLLKLNSSKAFNGLEVLLDIHEDTGIYDMTGLEGEVGMKILPMSGDRVIALADLGGKLTHVFVYDRPEFMQTFEAECQHCKKVVEWKMWNKENTLPTTTGHYQLQNNISGMTVQQAIKEDQKVCLDLNGMTVDGKMNARVYTMHNPNCELAIMDTSEGQKGVLRGHSENSDQGGVVWVRYGAFYLYAGTLDASDMVSKLNGTAVDVTKGSYFYMHGGKIIGGTAKWQKNDKGKYTNGVGGAVTVRGKFVLNDGIIEGGTALGRVTAKNADGTPKTYQRGYAGNVYVQSGGEFEMHGGIIRNGTATFAGGNVYVDGTGHFLMDGGVISGGKVTGKGRNGGNVFVTAKSTFDFNGGSIINGVSYNCAANVYLNGKVTMRGGHIGGGKILNWGTKDQNFASNSANVFNVNGKFIMYGGSIDGSFQAIDTAVDKTQTLVLVSGYATIMGPETDQCDDLYLSTGGDGITVRVGKLYDRAKIGVNAQTGIFTLPAAEHNVDNFFSNVDDADICYVDGCIALGRLGGCECGVKSEDPAAHLGNCTGEQLFWAPISGTTMPNKTGNYYVPRVKDANGDLVTRTINCKEQSSMVENAVIHLDLSGSTLKAKENFRFYSLHNPGTVLTICDSSDAKTGTVVTHGEGTSQGNAVWLRYGEFTLYSGTLDGSKYFLTNYWNVGADAIPGTADDKTDARDGGTVAMGTGTTFNMYGGTIIGNKQGATTLTKTHKETTTETQIVDGKETEVEVVVTTEHTRNITSANGAALSVAKNGVFNMYGGTIRDGITEANGANIYASSSAKLNLYGGTIRDGKAGPYAPDGKTKAGWGGNIYIRDTAVVTLDGAEILGGIAGGNGGSVYIGSGTAVFNMLSGTISGGESVLDQGGNIFCSGQMNLLGGTVSDGRATAKKNGGNIAVNSSKDVLLQGVTVTGGYSGATGGNIGVSTTNQTGKLIIAEGTVISGGEAATNGGNLYIAPNNYNNTNPNAVVEITGGTITGGTAKGEGGNVCINASGEGVSTLTITGGTITEGFAKTGGGIRVGKGAVLTIDGENAIIEKNESSDHGGNTNIAGTVTLVNGTIQNGKAGNTAGNAYVTNTGLLIVKGGKILGGTDKNGANADESSIYVVNGDVELRGGYMDGGIYVFNYKSNDASIKMSGNPVIKSDTRNGLRFHYSGEGATHIPYIEIDEPMTEGAEVYVYNTNWQIGKFTTATEEEYAKYFHADDDTRSIGFIDSCVALGKTNCVCGAPEGEHYGACTGEQLFWMPWSSSSSLPTTSGNWYIHPSVNVTLPSQWKPAAGAVINLDLNGKTVTCGARAIALNNAGVKVAITDTSAKREGKIFKTGTYTGQGGILWITAGSHVDLYAGIIDGTGYVNGSNGGAVCVEGASSFNMFGGTIKGTTSKTNGGNVAVKGTSVMTMTGGTIEGGKAFETGANLYITGDAKVYISGGKILDGAAGKDYVTDSTKNGWGGNVEVAGNGYLSLSGDAVISGGKTTGNGGNIRISGSTALMEMSGGTVEKGTSNDNGGNIFVYGNLTVTGGTIKDGTSKNGGNISANTAGTVSISNVTISGGQSTTGQGGNLRVFNNAAATLILNNVTLTGGKSAEAKMTAANLDVTVGATVNITDTKIDGYASIVDPDAKITLSGKVEITGAETNLTLGGAMLNLVDFSEESMIGINYAKGGYFTTATEEKFKANFTSDDPDLFVDFVDGKMVLALGRYSCLCGKNAEPHDAGCDGEKHFWLPWNSSTSLPAETGYWYLTQDEINVAGNIWLDTDQDIVLNLNGKTVKNAEGKNFRFYTFAAAGGSLVITDTVGGGQMINNGTYTQGMIAWGAAENVSITLIKGKLDVSGATPGTYAFSANAICLEKAKSTFTMYGGEVLGGKSNFGGGAIACLNWNSNLKLYGGTVTGHAEEPYPAVHLRGDGNLIAGGTITGGVELNSMRFDTSSTPGGAYLTLKGAPAIDSLVLTDDKDDRTGYKDFLKMPVVKIEGVLTNTTPIKVSTMDDVCTVFTQKVDAANASKFEAANEGQTVVWINDEALADYGKLYIGRAKCLCGATDGNHTSYTDAEGNTVGCDGTYKPWMAWTSTEVLPTTSGYWYLTADVNCTTQSSIGKNQKVVLDLNGKTVKPAQEEGKDVSIRIYSLHNPGADLTITDTAGGGKLIGSATKNDQGNVVWVRRDSTWNADDNIGTFVLMGGELIGNNPDCTRNGGVVNINSFGTFYMLGGKITDGTALYGGNLFVDDNAKAYLVAGEIADGTAMNGHGGNVCADPNSTVIMYKDMTISGGSAQREKDAGGEGGNLKIYGTFTMEGGTIQDGVAGPYVLSDGTTKAGWGGNIHGHAASNITIKGGTISGGNAGGNGGNINANKTLTISGGTISGGESKLDRGGNIWMGASATLNITGGTIENGKAGGDRGGNIHANANAVLNLTGGKISGGSVKGSTSNISANINWEGGTGKVTIGGSANVTGGVYIRNASTVIEVSGKPVISGGSTNLTPVNNITVGTLESGAKIGINREPGAFTTNTVDASYASYFTSDKTGTDVAYATDGVDNGKLAVGKVYAECGKTEAHDAHDYCDGELHTWLVWSAANTDVPEQSNTNKIGYWYLEEDLTATAGVGIGSGKGGRKVRFDLNGNDIIMQFTGGGASRLYSTNGLGSGSFNLLLTNLSSEKSAIVVDDTNQGDDRGGDQGRIIWMTSGNVKTYVNNVDIDLSKAKTDFVNNAREPKLGIAFTVGNGRELHLTDVDITGGTDAQGPAIYVHDAGKAVLHNVTIQDHKGSTHGGGIYVDNASASLTLSGNTVISGCTKLDGTAANITFTAVPTFALTESYVGSTSKPQGIDAPVDTVILSEVGGEWFASDNADKKVVYTEAGMKLVAADAAVYCVCGSSNATHAEGCDGVDYEWVALTDINDLKTPGNYYLTQNYKAAMGQIAFKTGHTRLDLNGYTITDTSSRFATTNGTTDAKITVTDNYTGEKTTERPGGAIAVDHSNAAKTYDGQGICFWIAGGNCELNWFRGTLDASKAKNYQYGATAVYVSGTNTFNLYGGTVKGGTCERTVDTPSNKIGTGAGVRILANATMNMYGGTIEGGTIKGGNGGSLAVAGVLNMYDGTIKGGKAESVTLDGTAIEVYGGNIYLTGTMNMYGGTVTGGAAYRGGNIAVEGGTLNFVDGTISSGDVTAINDTVKKHLGGNIFLNGVLNMSGGTVEDGRHDNKNGHVASNIAVAASGKLNMTGGTVTGRISAFETRVDNVVSFSGKVSAIGGNAVTMSWGLPVYVGELEEGSALRFRITDGNTKYLEALDGYTLDEDDVKCVTAFYNSSSNEGTVTLDKENNRIVISPAS